MRKTSVAVVFAVALVCAMLANSRGSSANPIISSPTPVPQANITIRHTLDGVPFIVLTDRPWNARVGDSECGLVHTAEVSLSERLVDVVSWPWPQCDSAGKPISFCYRVTLCSDQFYFDGHDVTVDMPWSREAQFGVFFPIATAHFVRDGRSQAVTITAWSYTTGDVTCHSGTSNYPVLTTDITVLWPEGQICGQPGSEGHARFTTQEFGDVKGTFDFAGNDVTFDVDVGPSATATPTPSTQVSSPSPMPPTPSPASLPRAGGQPDTDGVPIAALAGSLVALAGAAMLARAWAGRKRRA